MADIISFIQQLIINVTIVAWILFFLTWVVGWALKGASYGMYFSIPPSVWFSRQKQNIVKVLPLESLMLESDSPVLSPIRNTRNEPANILYSARKISEIKRVSFEKVIEVTSTNAMEFFGIKL